MIVQLYNEETLKVMIPQGSLPKFTTSFTKEMYDEWKINTNVLSLGCGCTSFDVDKDLEQITFTIQAPEFGYPLPTPYLKTVSPKFKSKLTNLEIIWEIKFNVNPVK
jgi:hypothetical protein